MKLVSYEKDPGRRGFGAVLNGHVVDFSELARALGVAAPGLESMESYLAGLPESEQGASHLLRNASETSVWIKRPLWSAKLLAPLPRPAALLDCALTPEHLANSTAMLLRRSLPPPIGRMAAWLTGRLIERSSRRVRYYKCNHNAVIGPGDTLAWPSYTAYLDIEPELAVITGEIPVGASRQEVASRIAGYLIFNDGSARDVQLSEMLFTGPASAKDFDSSKGLGPYLVTPDEVGDPMALAVSIRVGVRPAWNGTTAQYVVPPIEAVHAIAARQSLAAGTTIGLGRIPGCCGLDRDEWIHPGERIAISIEKLGTLEHTVGVPTTIPNTRWQKRRDIAVQ